MITLNRSWSFPARTSESMSEVYGTFHRSNTQRVQPSSIGAADDLERPRRTEAVCGARGGGPGGLTLLGVTGTESGTRSESFAATAVTPIRSGRVWAVTSYGRSGGPPG